MTPRALALCAVLCLAGGCSSSTGGTTGSAARLRPLGEGWYTYPVADTEPSPHLYQGAGASRRIVDRGILSRKMLGTCLVYEANRADAPVLFIASADRIPLAIAESRPERSWYFDGAAIRRYHPTSEGTRRLVDIERFNAFDLCHKASLQPPLRDDWAAAPPDFSGITSQITSVDMDARADLLARDGYGRTATDWAATTEMRQLIEPLAPARGDR